MDHAAQNLHPGSAEDNSICSSGTRSLRPSSPTARQARARQQAYRRRQAPRPSARPGSRRCTAAAAIPIRRCDRSSDEHSFAICGAARSYSIQPRAEITPRASSIFPVTARSTSSTRPASPLSKARTPAAKTSPAPSHLSSLRASSHPPVPRHAQSVQYAPPRAYLAFQGPPRKRDMKQWAHSREFHRKDAPEEC